MERTTLPFALLLVFGVTFALVGCATLSEERAQVRSMVTARLDCPPDWHGPHVEEADDSPVRHWSATCNHHAVRITCDRQGCSEQVQRPRLLCDSPLDALSPPAGGAASAGSSDPGLSH